jgi:hypothetical protein
VRADLFCNSGAKGERIGYDRRSMRTLVCRRNYSAQLDTSTRQLAKSRWCHDSLMSYGARGMGMGEADTHVQFVERL